MLLLCGQEEWLLWPEIECESTTVVYPWLSADVDPCGTCREELGGGNTEWRKIFHTPTCRCSVMFHNFYLS